LLYTSEMVGAASPLVGKRIIQPGMTIVLPFDESVSILDAPAVAGEEKKVTTKSVTGSVTRFTVNDVNGAYLFVTSAVGVAFTNKVCDGKIGIGGAVSGAILVKQKEPCQYETQPGKKAWSSMVTLPNKAVTDYTIARAELHLCSVQLTDAVQRALNEYSSQSGLEIVYADYDRTTQPLISTGSSNPIYMEIRKSASRALAAMARIVNVSPDPHTYDSFASCPYSYWNEYQWQLGSLYFPHQPVKDTNADDDIRADNVLSLAYSYTLDAYDRYHPKAAPTSLSHRGNTSNPRLGNYYPVGSIGEQRPSDYLTPYSSFGKWGSFVNGATTIATTLERSSAFDLSGIPTNNSRTLALRGNVGFRFPAGYDSTNFKASVVAFLKFIKLARCYLLNCEVEQ